jgi:hypothetical protein
MKLGQIRQTTLPGKSPDGTSTGITAPLQSDRIGRTRRRSLESLRMNNVLRRPLAASIVQKRTGASHHLQAVATDRSDVRKGWSAIDQMHVRPVFVLPDCKHGVSMAACLRHQRTLRWARQSRLMSLSPDSLGGGPPRAHLSGLARQTRTRSCRRWKACELVRASDTLRGSTTKLVDCVFLQSHEILPEGPDHSNFR